MATQPTVAVRVNLTSGLRYGVKPGDVRRKVATLLSGIQVGSVFQEEKVFDVVVRAEPDARRSLTDIRRLLIDVPGGGYVRLGNVADVRVRSTPGVIQREASQRRIDISANVGGRSVGDVRSDVRDRIRDLRFPLEYHAEAIGAASGDRATVGTPARLRDRRRDRDLPAPAGGFPELAPGGPGVRDLADRPSWAACWRA